VRTGKILKARLRPENSDKWIGTSIVARLNLSWGDQPIGSPQKYSTVQLAFRTCRFYYRSPEFRRDGGPKRLGFFISIDPGHWRFVDPIFSKRGLYKIVVQLSALNVEPDRLTLFVNWDGAKLVILSDADEILETAEVLSA